MTRTPPLFDSCANFTGNPEGCNELVAYGGKWFAPSPGYRNLMSRHGERMVRTFLFNSDKVEATPATVTPELAAIVDKLCVKAKEGR